MDGNLIVSIVQSDGFHKMQAEKMDFNSLLISGLKCSSKHFLSCMVLVKYIASVQGIINSLELRD